MVKEIGVEKLCLSFPIDMEHKTQIKAFLSGEQLVKNGVLVSSYKNPKDNSLVYVLNNHAGKEILVELGDKKIKSYSTYKSHDTGLSMQDLSRVIIPARSTVLGLN
jgi:hypothetical protein